MLCEEIPRIKQLGKGLSSSYCFIISPDVMQLTTSLIAIPHQSFHRFPSIVSVDILYKRRIDYIELHLCETVPVGAGAVFAIIGQKF